MERFIVGTGRCGSTLLSRMLSSNTAVLNIFEFFSGLDLARRFDSTPTDGICFASMLEHDTPALTMTMKRGYEIDEVVYPFGEGMRYQPRQGLPWVAAAALARMSEDPDALFDQMLEEVRTYPSQPIGDHYARLFAWLCSWKGRGLWIEKSGSSIEYLGALHGMYPDARFLHLHRDGREAALSMRAHHVYRLWVALLYGSPEELPITYEELAGLDPAAEPTADDPITQMLETAPPVELFGRYWSELTLRGLRAVGALDARQYMEVAFEDLVARPQQMLELIADFLQLPAEPTDWGSRAAALVRGIPPTRVDKLDDDDRRRLDDACRPARLALGQCD